MNAQFIFKKMGSRSGRRSGVKLSFTGPGSQWRSCEPGNANCSAIPEPAQQGQDLSLGATGSSERRETRGIEEKPMQFRKRTLCALIGLVLLIATGGCSDALEDGLVAGVETGVTSGINSLIIGVFQGLSVSLLGEGASIPAGGPPF